MIYEALRLIQHKVKKEYTFFRYVGIANWALQRAIPAVNFPCCILSFIRADAQTVKAINPLERSVITVSFLVACESVSPVSTDSGDGFVSDEALEVYVCAWSLFEQSKYFRDVDSGLTLNGHPRTVTNVTQPESTVTMLEIITDYTVSYD